MPRYSKQLYLNEILFDTMRKKTGRPEMIAFVDAIAGMMFFTTPCVNDHVTPSILNSAARAAATLYSHPICSGSSVSSFFSEIHLKTNPN